MASKLENIPEPPTEIIEAAKDNRLVLFIGTGPSISMGAANWNQFADNVLNQLRKKEIIDYAFIDQLSNLDPRKRLSIARSLAEEEGVEIDYKKSVMPSEKDSTESKIYEHLLGIGSHFVTTNYDDYLDQPIHKPFESQDEARERKIIDKNIIYNPSNINSDSFSEPNTVVHLHGSFSSESTEKLVITTEDYLNHYYYDNDLKSGIRDFLEMLFDGFFTILFVGYGLQELELLEYILAKSEDSSEDSRTQQRTRFWLQGCFSHEKNTYAQLKKYYSENFNIEMLLYSLDQKHYSALEDIMAKWGVKINSETTPTSKKIRFANEAIQDE
ncbi:SIR2-like domain-containing protein [Fodinibius salinus]|uniref:SIR2-like domain-containing protein n=1 Tax=Fodinibius salinus TaxID=860790 RepID=A0A5D3YND7_9BACT|nr:SIR2 family protein [Fodinibius salinus]TYP94858.1 SIR2-like domain-containing protein [Fodinibius salinus]